MLGDHGHTQLCAVSFERPRRSPDFSSPATSIFRKIAQNTARSSSGVGWRTPPRLRVSARGTTHAPVVR